MRRAPRSVPRARGFSLVEIAVGLVILGLSAAGLVAVIGQQSEHRRLVETRASLSAARDALLAYVAANGRLPCPATAASAGQESRVAPGSAQCTQTAGLLPAVTLGLPGLDANGLLVDGWADGAGNGNGTFLRAIRYAVAPTAPTAPNALTATGLGNPTLAGRQQLAAAFAANEGLFVCRSATGAVAAGNRCGGAANTLSSSAAAVLWSQGPNGNQPGAWSADEQQNANQTVARVLVSRETMPAGAVGGAFDDVATWISFQMVVDRLLTAGHTQ